MYFYFYKITNLINKKFYFGVHSTKNLDDGYMGSGVAIKKAYEKYGMFNFQKEILMFFENEKEMYEHEEKIVDEKMIKNPDCYNMIIGGRSQKTQQQLTNLSKEKYCNTPEYHFKRSQMSKDIAKKYWSSEKGAEEKRRNSLRQKEIWTEGKRIEHGKMLKEIFDNNPEIKSKTREKLKKYWECRTDEERKNHGVLSTQNDKFRDFCKKLSETNKLYDNFDFKNRWESVYLKNKDEICSLILETDLPDSFIIKNIFNKQVKTERLLKYYEYMGFLPKEKSSERKSRFIYDGDLKNNKGHKDGSSKKTIYSKPKYKFIMFFEDFFEQFEEIKKINNDLSISDSQVVQGENHKNIKNYFQVMEYFEEIGILTNKRKTNIKINKTVQNKTFLLTTTKTIFDVKEKNKEVIIFDKELNYYGIDDNGKAFREGRIEFERDGNKCSIRCIRTKHQNKEL